MFAAGTKVSIKDLVSESSEYSEITGASDFTPPNQSWNTTEVSYLNQATGIKRRIKTSLAGGDASFTLSPRVGDKGAILLEAAYNDKENEYGFKVEMPDGSFFEFYGIVTEFSQQQMTPDGVNTHNVVIQVNSKVLYTAAAS